MGRDVEHPRLVPENSLRAVPVVHVPVQDKDPLALVDQGGGGNGHVVYETEAHRLVGCGVVAGWAMGDKAHPLAGVPEGLDRRQYPAGGQKGSVPGPGAGYGVEVQRPPARVAEVLERPEVLGGVDLQQLLHRGSPGRQGDDGVAEASTVDALEDGLHPARAFGVRGARLMVVELWRRTQVEHALEAKAPPPGPVTPKPQAWLP